MALTPRRCRVMWGREPLMKVRLTRLADGDILGITLSHCLTDGMRWPGFLKHFAARYRSDARCWARCDRPCYCRRWLCHLATPPHCTGLPSIDTAYQMAQWGRTMDNRLPTLSHSAAAGRPSQACRRSRRSCCVPAAAPTSQQPSWRSGLACECDSGPFELRPAVVVVVVSGVFVRV